MEYTLGRLRTLLTSIPGTIAVYKVQGDSIAPLLYSGDVPAFSGLSEAEYLALYRSDATAIVAEQDRSYLLPRIREVLDGKGDCDATFRTWHKTKGYIWTHVNLKLLGTMGGQLLLLGIFANVNEIIESSALLPEMHTELEQELNEERTKYRVATEGANLRVYEYDILKHCIHLPEHSRKLFGVPQTDIGNVPDSILHLFHPEDAGRVRDFFARVDRGEKTVKDDFLMKEVNGSASFLRYTFSTVFDGSGKAVKAYAVAEDITAQKREEENFSKSIQTLLSTNPEALCTFQVNLSMNSCSGGHGTSRYIQSLLLSETADGLFGNIVSIISDREQRVRAAEIFDRHRLLELYSAGKTSLHLDYRRIGENGRPFWVRTYASMLRDPQSDDVVAVFYSVDISKEMLQNEIFNIITNQEYDYVALLHSKINKIEFLKLSDRLLPKYHNIFGQPGMLYDFDKVREFAASSWIDQADRANYLKSSPLREVLKQLDKNGHYELSVRGHYTGHPETTMCRKIQHYYLESEEDSILIIESDVTKTYLQEQKEAELRQAQLKEQQARTMQETLIGTIGSLPVNAALFLVDSGSYIPQSYSNDFCHMKGCTQESIWELSTDDGFSPIHPDDRKHVREFLEYHWKDSSPYSTIYRVIVASGAYKWVNVTFTNLTINGKIYLYAVYADIDDLKKQEQLFEEQYRSAQAFVDSVSGIYLATRRSNLTRNQVEMVKGTSTLPSVSVQTDYDSSIQTLLEFMPREQDRKECARFYSREALLRAYSEGTHTLSLEYQLLSREGVVQWVKCVLNLTKRPESGDIICFSAVRDISRDKFSESIMLHMIARQYDFIACIDVKKNKIVLLLADNSGQANGTEFIRENSDYEESIQAYNAKYVLPEELHACAKFATLSDMKAALKNGGDCSVTFTVNENGALRNKKVEFFYIDRESSLIALIRSDYTEMQKKQLEQESQLRCALEAAQQANAAKTEFLSRMSHDIRTPLNGIIGMTYLAGEENNPPRTRDCLAKISTSSNFLLGLINDILDMAKAESNKMELHPEPYASQEFCAYIDAVFRPLCAEKNQKFSTSIHPVRDCMPLVDKLRFNQIFFNLLSNAVKYTPEGGTIDLTMDSFLTDRKRFVIEGRIHDSGIGMSGEFQKVLFDPFTQEGRNDNSRSRGSGLGLAITKKMVDLMKGSIQVDSALGKGSTFTVRLEADCVPISELQPDRSRPEAEPSGMALLQGKHVLLCEDHPLNQEIAQALLAQKGIIVSTAEDGQKGLEMFVKSAAGYYDAILMDIRMPVMDGYAATRAIRALKAKRPDADSVPIIAMTADAFADDVSKCIASGMNAHLAKPIEPSALYRALGSAFSKTQY